MIMTIFLPALLSIVSSQATAQAAALSTAQPLAFSGEFVLESGASCPHELTVEYDACQRIRGVCTKVFHLRTAENDPNGLYRNIPGLGEGLKVKDDSDAMIGRLWGYEVSLTVIKESSLVRTVENHEYVGEDTGFSRRRRAELVSRSELTLTLLPGDRLSFHESRVYRGQVDPRDTRSCVYARLNVPGTFL